MLKRWQVEELRGMVLGAAERWAAQVGVPAGSGVREVLAENPWLREVAPELCREMLEGAAAPGGSRMLNLETAKEDLNRKVLALAESKGCSYLDAFRELRTSDPELYRVAMTDYAPPPPERAGMGRDPNAGADVAAVQSVVTMAQRIVAERGVPFPVALDEVRTSNPSLFAAATKHYR